MQIFPVTPLVGVWIEILMKLTIRYIVWSLPLWECGLKYCLLTLLIGVDMSLPLWECGLKSCE